MKVKYITVAVGLACCATGSAFAAAPTSGAYTTDPQHEWVQDKLAENIGTPNMIMCFVSALRADALVNQGNYVALVDMDKCDASKRGQDNSGSTNSGASAATNYTRVIVNSTRASNSDPMIANAWFVPPGGGPGGTQQRIFARATVNAAPSDTNPNGDFSVAFCGVDAALTNPLTGTCSNFLGSMTAGATALTFAEDGMGDNMGTPTPYTTRLTISKSSTGGSGRIQAAGQGPGTVDLGFVYDSLVFKRGNTQGSQCFSRDRANADYSTWRYGVYNSDGSRLDLAHPGFPIQATFNGQTYWGGASFWGIFLPDNVLDNVSQVTRMTPGSNATTTYDLTKSGGKLYKMTKVAGTLADLKGQSIMLYIPGSVVAGDAMGGQYELSWDGTNLVAVRKQGVCDMNGCNSWTDLTGTPTYVTAGSLRTNAPYMQALQGFSQSAGGEVRIEVPASGEFADASLIATRTRDVVVPGSVTPSLVCINRCPKGALQASDFTGNTVFQDITFIDWTGSTQTASSEFSFQPVATTSAIAYSFSSAGLLMSGTDAVDASALTLSGNNQQGLQSGRLLDSASASYTAARCSRADNFSPYLQSDTGDTICPWMVDNVLVYYTYETGPNAWNRYVGLSSGSQAVTFDPPMNFALTVSTANTTELTGSPLIGSKVQLNYNGFGDLQGIPGTCVDTNTNQPVICGTGNNNSQRWVPAFSIKDGAELTSGSTSYYVKYLEREMRFGKVAGSDPLNANCSALDLTASLAASLPGAPSNDPRATMSVEPTVTDAPKVIHGTVQ